MRCKLFIPSVFFLFMAGMTIIFPAQALSKDKILLGAVVPLTGPEAGAVDCIQVSNYKLWVEEVNARGGLYIRDMKKSLPLELKLYDDRGDVRNGIRLYEKLIREDHADLLLAPWGTAMHMALAPVINQHGYPLIGISMGSESMRSVAYKLPYFFGILNMPREQIFALVQILDELKIKSAAVFYNSGAHGTETTNLLMPALKLRGIRVPVLERYSPDTQDFSPLLQSVRASGAEAFITICYPHSAFRITAQARAIGLNPRLFFMTVGVALPIYRDKFGADTVEGIMGGGVWNPRLPYPGGREYFERYRARWHRELDRWGGAFSYASLQILEKAIAEVGSLDRKKIRDVIASRTFSTVIGPVRFEGGFNIQSPGEIGQWQNGEFEVVGRREKRTANLIYPKPRWKK